METSAPDSIPMLTNVSNKFGKLSLICSLIGWLIFLLSNFVWVPRNTILMSVACLLGVVFYFKQRKVQVTTIATIGAILGLIGLLLGVYVTVDIFNPIYDPVACKWESGCRYTRQQLKADSIVIGVHTTSDCKRIKGKFIDERDRCYRMLILRTGDISLCDLMHSSNSKDECFSIMAGFSLDTKLCDKIVSRELSADCYQAVNNKINENPNSPYQCEGAWVGDNILIQEIKQGCYERVSSNCLTDEQCIQKYGEGSTCYKNSCTQQTS